MLTDNLAAREEVLTDNLAARINDAAGKYERAGNAIDSDGSPSSTRLRTKDFQRHGLRRRHGFGWFGDHGFAGVGSCYRSQHRPGPDAGFPGRLSVVHVWSYRHDVAADRH